MVMSSFDWIQLAILLTLLPSLSRSKRAVHRLLSNPRIFDILVFTSNGFDRDGCVVLVFTIRR